MQAGQAHKPLFPPQKQAMAHTPMPQCRQTPQNLIEELKRLLEQKERFV